MVKLYVTYAMGSYLCNCYSVVEAESYQEARNIVDRVTNGKFAFDYTGELFEHQVEKYGLKEVPLQPQEMIDD